MTTTKREGLEMRGLTAEEIAVVAGGVVTGGVQPIVTIPPAADPPDTTCGTKGPGAHNPFVKM